MLLIILCHTGMLTRDLSEVTDLLAGLTSIIKQYIS